MTVGNSRLIRRPSGRKPADSGSEWAVMVGNPTSASDLIEIESHYLTEFPSIFHLAVFVFEKVDSG